MIERHYDLSDELFALFLDETMTYSAALFPRDDLGLPVGGFDVLAEAQCRKLDRLLDLCDVGSRTRLLEIGSGWGSLALRAASRGARVTTITLSSNQQYAVRRRAAAAGLGDLVDVRLIDYRDARGQYDAVVSVEMIEAVGREHWPAYFSALRRLTAPGGRIGLQANHHAAPAYACGSGQSDLDHQVHLPRRHHPVAGRNPFGVSDRRPAPAPRVLVRPGLRPHPAAVA
ncbi:cyclopropane fatty-acyl-phospholipid synthase-like methyltransferase [Catenulispora sp. GAS73]